MLFSRPHVLEPWRQVSEADLETWHQVLIESQGLFHFFETCSRCLIRIFFLNIFIGVIGELYQVEKDRSAGHLPLAHLFNFYFGQASLLSNAMHEAILPIGLRTATPVS